MKKLSYLVLSTIFFLVACGNSDTTTTENVTDSTAVTTTEPTPEQEVPSTMVATFNDCTVYTAVTIYTFTTEKGEKWEVEVQNGAGLSGEDLELARENGLVDTDIKFSDPLIDPSKDLEGLPGANPAMVGKQFSLVFNDKGKLTEITLKK